jgi:hypothetical protein
VLPAYTMSDSYWVFENSLLDACVRRLIQYFLRVGRDLHASRVELGTALYVLGSRHARTWAVLPAYTMSGL